MFSINEGEIPVYSECSLFLVSGGSTVSLVTKDKNDKYFLYDHGKRKGPYDDAKEITWEKDEEGGLVNSIAEYDESRMNHEKVLSYSNDGKARITSGGKTFGPFDLLLNLYITKDGRLTAAVSSDGFKTKLLTQSGTSLELESVPAYTCASPSGKTALIVTVREYDPSRDFANIDFSKLTTEQIAKIAQDMEEKQKKAPPPQAFLYLHNGKKLGPYPKNSFSGNNPAFCVTGGENWFMTIEGKLYVNGTLLANLGSEYVSNDDIWLSADGKRYAIVTYDYIRFSDGASFRYPLVVKTMEKDGKTWLTWISLENEKDVVHYSRPL
jgi:hypothetical protein